MKRSYQAKKFMQVLDVRVYNRFVKLGKKRGIGIQEYLRAVVIPEWEAFVMTRQSFVKKVKKRVGSKAR